MLEINQPNPFSSTLLRGETMVNIPPKGTVLGLNQIKELSDRGYDTYLVKVESTIDIIIIKHYGDGIGIIVIDPTTGDGIYTGCFRNIKELRSRVRHDDEYYYFTLMTPYEIRVRKNQLEEILRKIDDYFFKREQ